MRSFVKKNTPDILSNFVYNTWVRAEVWPGLVAGLAADLVNNKKSAKILAATYTKYSYITVYWTARQGRRYTRSLKDHSSEFYRAWEGQRMVFVKLYAFGATGYWPLVDVCCVGTPNA